jgi:hypothetical protein
VRYQARDDTLFDGYRYRERCIVVVTSKERAYRLFQRTARQFLHLLKATGSIMRRTMLGTLKVVRQGVKHRRPMQMKRLHDADLLLKCKGCTGQ